MTKAYRIYCRYSRRRGNISSRSMMVDFHLLGIKLSQCEQHDLNEGNQLSEDEPDVHHADIGCGRQLFHHASTVEVKISSSSGICYLMNNVVMTSITVKLTVRAASKQKGLKNVVEQVIRRRRKEGRQVVRSSFVSLRLNTISIFNPLLMLPVR